MDNDIIAKINTFEQMAGQDFNQLSFTEFIEFTTLVMEICTFFIEKTGRLYEDAEWLRIENDRLNALFDQMMEIRND